MRFRKGDYVVIIDNFDGKQHDHCIGKTAKVSQKEPNPSPYYNLTSIGISISNPWEGRELRKATKKEKEHYKQLEVENEI